MFNLAVWKCPAVDGDDPVYFEDDGYCNVFYECSNGAAIRFVCPTATNWNQTLTTCAFGVDCEGKQILTTTTTSTTTAET